MIQISRFQLWSAFIVVLLGLIFASPNLLPEPVAKSLPSYVPHQRFNLGLDLRGGAYLLLEANMTKVIDENLKDLRNQVRQRLRDEKLLYENLRAVQRGVSFRVVDPASVDKARDVANRIARDLGSSGGLFSGRSQAYEVRTEGTTMTLRLSDVGVASLHDRILEQAMEILRKRIDPDGTKEVTIQRQGTARVIVEVPGVSDTAEIRTRIGTTAKMTFHMVHPSILAPTAGTSPPPGYLLVKGNKEESGWYLVKEDPELDGTHLVDASAQFQDRGPVIAFRFDSAGARIFCKITQENIGKPFAIVLDNEVISAPNIKSAICGGSGIIEGGNMTLESATRTALLLRAGALPAEFTVAEERTVGATLGADAIDAGIWASILGLALVVVYMVAGYGLFGVFAIMSLLINLVLLAAMMSLMQSTFTLPGIAGVVLSLGMAVDANVLIYERMREEIRLGRTALSAIDSGFRRAFTAIVDTHVTTIMAGFLLYLFGSGPVRGFGVTLALGLTASIFTAYFLTRIQVVYWWRWHRPKLLPI